jgi:hypothetical protein
MRFDGRPSGGLWKFWIRRTLSLAVMGRPSIRISFLSPFLNWCDIELLHTIRASTSNTALQVNTAKISGCILTSAQRV